ncbi:hypothetical protein ABBQ32_003738 [Trebouxia sp. C0010 RCD-2024]
MAPPRSGSLASVDIFPSTYAICSFSSEEDLRDAEPVSPTSTVGTCKDARSPRCTSLALLACLSQHMSIEHARIVVLHIKPEGLPQLMHSLTVDEARRCLEPDSEALASPRHANDLMGTDCKISCDRSTQTDMPEHTAEAIREPAKQGIDTDLQSTASAVHRQPAESEDTEAAECLEALLKAQLHRTELKGQTSKQTMTTKPAPISRINPYDRAVAAWDRLTSEKPWRSIIELHPKNQQNGQWKMFQRASNGALLTLDLHSWSDDCEAACEVLRPCEAAAAAEAYFTVIKNSFGTTLRGDPVHVITGKGDGIQLKAVKQCLVGLREKRVVRDYHAVHAGGFHVFLQ